MCNINGENYLGIISIAIALTQLYCTMVELNAVNTKLWSNINILILALTNKHMVHNISIWNWSNTEDLNPHKQNESN